LSNVNYIGQWTSYNSTGTLGLKSNYGKLRIKIEYDVYIFKEFNIKMKINTFEALSFYITLTDGLFDDKTVTFYGRTKYEGHKDYLNFNKSEFNISYVFGKTKISMFLVKDLSEYS